MLITLNPDKSTRLGAFFLELFKLVNVHEIYVYVNVQEKMNKLRVLFSCKKTRKERCFTVF